MWVVFASKTAAWVCRAKHGLRELWLRVNANQSPSGSGDVLPAAKLVTPAACVPPPPGWVAASVQGLGSEAAKPKQTKSMNGQPESTLQDQLLKILFADGLGEGPANIAHPADRLQRQPMAVLPVPSPAACRPPRHQAGTQVHHRLPNRRHLQRRIATPRRRAPPRLLRNLARQTTQARRPGRGKPPRRLHRLRSARSTPPSLSRSPKPGNPENPT